MVKLLYFVRAAAAGLRHHPFVHFVSALTMAVALFAAGAGRFAAATADSALASWGSGVELTVYLAPGADAAAAERLADELRRTAGVEARPVSAEQALVRLRADLGEHGDVLEGLPRNPLPASVEVRPPAHRRSAAALAELAAAWSRLPGVESVEYGREWVDRLERLTRAVRGAGALLLLAVLLAAVVVAGATLQLAIHARRDEIEILQLVGATDAFVKAPFLIEGLMQGALGAGMAAAGLWAAGRWVGPRLAEAVSFSSWGVAAPALLDGAALAELAAAGMGLGLLGSLLALRRFSKP